MTSSTTIRVSIEQRERLRSLAEQRHSSLSATLDAALESLRRQAFFDEMAAGQESLRHDPDALARYERDGDQWLNADLG
jgi:predicted transcriptional regulator